MQIQIFEKHNKEKRDFACKTIHIELFLKYEPQLSRIVVSAAAVGERLKAWGVCAAKISHIPIGTDVGLFVPPSFQQREEARKKLGFSPEAIVIGSFQKDA